MFVSEGAQELKNAYPENLYQQLVDASSNYLDLEDVVQIDKDVNRTLREHKSFRHRYGEGYAWLLVYLVTHLTPLLWLIVLSDDLST